MGEAEAEGAKFWLKVLSGLKPIYQVPTLAEAEDALKAQKWDDKYPAISQIWLRHWENVIPIFDYRWRFAE